MSREYISRLFRHVHSGSDRTAFALGERQVSWAELDALSRRYAAGLSALGLERGDRVAVIVETSIDMIVALLGHYRLGLVHVPVNTAYRDVEVGHILRDSGARAVLVDAGTPSHEVLRGLDAPQPLAHRIVLGGEDLDEAELGFDALLDTEPLVGEPVPEDDDLSLFIYTSGTTGKSKGVEHTYRSVVSNIDNLTGLWQWSTDDRQVLALPLFHVHGLGIGVHGTLIRGCTTTLHEAFDAERVAEAVGDGATIFMGVPTMHTRLVRLMDADPTVAEKLSGARLFTSGSAALPVDIFEKFRDHTGHAILERYGMSETMLTLSNPYEEERRPGTVGFPVPGCEVRVVDADMNDVTPEQTGQIVVRGDSVMRGYWKQPERTEEAFEDGWFLTGDVATVDEDGYISIVGRQSVDIIKSGGYKISAREIERVLRQNPKVLEVAVVGLPDPEWGEKIAAAVVPTDEARAGADEAAWLDEFASQVEDSLASYKKPRALAIIDQLPRNALGKVQKHRLVERFSK
ncbi:AMP-binding protein [Persicimonas caeni]|uniref:AMP-binding protein n=1 Tax=Persicimonas caeni TaxID=2292766 RepID=A0A4Y6PPT9_PERCE|nr:acyl-CoA synthetase [Persicimonas caeni]QDG50352.1 AMP-binding protein [Persicimonas caeni]QED31573.1 AMP-binding protein [Persicimonas caeni]